MDLGLLLSRLASAQTRASASRGLAVGCAAGYLVTLAALAARGTLAQWFFALLVWALFVYAPLRIALEAAATLAPALRRRLAAQAAAGARRFTLPASAELAVDRLLDREVVMPRIATPPQREKARDGARAVLVALRGTTADLPAIVAAALGCLDRWVADIGPWAQRDAGQNIQRRWREARALAAMAAMARVLVAAARDAADAVASGRGAMPLPDSRRSAAHAPGHAGGPRNGDERERSTAERAGNRDDRAQFLDACLDYCDQLALEVEVQVWTGPALDDARLLADRAVALRDAWRTYMETGAPALEARNTFVDLLMRTAQTARGSSGPR